MVSVVSRLMYRPILLLILYLGFYLTIMITWTAHYHKPITSMPQQDRFLREQLKHANNSTMNYEIPENMFAWDFGNGSRFDLKETVKLLEQPWKNNISYISEFRHKLSNFTKSLKNLFVTKKNAKIGTKIHHVWWKNESQATITPEIYKYLPRRLPFTGNYSRCSVVGNSGILNNSSCGADIDKSDFIIRCNAPPIAKFEFDAGRKSNLTTLNPSILKRRYHFLKRRRYIRNYLIDMQQYKKFIWIPMFAVDVNVALCEKAAMAMRKSKLALIPGHPHHFIQVMNFWKQNEVTQTLTTGFYLTNMALQLCNEVHLYGFWPFNVDPNNNQIAYHYFDDVQLGGRMHNKKNSHNISSEFKALLNLHKFGALRIHLHC